MRRVLVRLLSAPAFEDEEKTRVATLLNAILLFILFLVVLFTLATLPTTANANDLLSEIILIVVTALLLFLMRRGYVQPAGYLLAFVLWAVITLGIGMGGGIRGPGMASYFGIIVIAGLLLGGRGAIAFGVLSVAGAAGLYLAESQGWLIPPSVPDSPGVLLEFAVTAAGVTVLLYMSSRSLSNALERARRNEKSVTASNRELTAIRATLEERNEQLRTAVRQYDSYMAQVGQGDLSGQLTLAEAQGAGDPLVTLGYRLNEATLGLRRMTDQIRQAAGDLSASAAEILAVSGQQVSEARGQSERISQTAATVEQVKNIATQSVVRAQEFAGTFQQTVAVSRSGRQAVQETVESMGRIKGRVESIAVNLQALAQQTQQIGQIIFSVNELAAQSNILALNAEVEAARAGVHGKSFAVVAGEVRHLAGQSHESTARVQGILEEIQKAAKTTMQAMEEGTREVEQGVQLAQLAGEAIEELTQVIADSAQASTQTAADGLQQAEVVGQIAQAMQAVDQATAQEVAGAYQLEKAVQGLNQLAQRLSDIIAHYRL